MHRIQGRVRREQEPSGRFQWTDPSAQNTYLLNLRFEVTRVALLAEQGFLESLYNPSLQIMVQSWRQLQEQEDSHQNHLLHTSSALQDKPTQHNNIHSQA